MLLINLLSPPMSHESPSHGEPARHNEDLEQDTLKSVLNEEEQILREIGQLLGRKAPKAEILAAIEQQYLPQLEEAGRRFDSALRAWRENIERQLADLERE